MSSDSLIFKTRRYRNSPSRVLSSQKTGKPMLKMPGVKLNLNSKTSSKVSKAVLLSNKLLLVGLRLLRYFFAIGNFTHSEEVKFVQGYVCTQV